MVSSEQNISNSKDRAGKFFHCTDHERAAFEAGIKLGAIYHQFVGTPVSLGNVDVLEKAIEEGVRVQPFVIDVNVKIDRENLFEKKHQYDYVSLTGNMLNVHLKVKYNHSIAVARIKYIDELHYPLMFISSLENYINQ